MFYVYTFNIYMCHVWDEYQQTQKGHYLFCIKLGPQLLIYSTTPSLIVFSMLFDTKKFGPVHESLVLFTEMLLFMKTSSSDMTV